MQKLISLDTPSKQFEQHISVKDNNRILFSGPFGIGKTTFIKNFFENNSTCTAITLRPINYAVASNEDIFKLIKYDILYQLLEKGLVEIEDFGKFTKLDLIQNFSSIAELKLITPFLETIPLIGGEISRVLLAFDKLRTKYKQHGEEMNTNQDIKAIEAFIDSLGKGHFLLENDFITETIKSAIERINSTTPNTSILVIDDLDRIDPEHIFRLFNIFSTHFDYNHESDNKFGFKKIIFICDHKNIQCIFQTKYGISTDFNGYIDKFYSTEIFIYNNHSAITEFITGILNVIPRSSLLNRRDIDFLSEILSSMLNYNAINLRSVIKSIHLHEHKRVNHTNNSDSFDNYYFTKIANTLRYIVGSSDALIEILKKCISISKETSNKNMNFTESNLDMYMCTYLAPILTYNSHQGKYLDNSYTVKDPIGGGNRKYSINKESHFFSAEKAGSSPHPQLYPELMWYHLLDTIKILKDRNAL
jgi:DNA polymerase III delta prime subunit